MSATPITFQLLRERFLAGLDRRLAHLNGCLAALREDGHAEKSAKLDEMMREFHSLAGIGGTYGYPSITSVARDGEIKCRAIGKRPSGSDVEVLAGVLTILIDVASSAASD